MKLIQSSRVSDKILGTTSAARSNKTMAEERMDAARQAAEHKANATQWSSKWVNAPAGEPARVYTARGNDEDRIIKEAADVLTVHISDLFGNKIARNTRRKKAGTKRIAGQEVIFDEFRKEASHEDKADFSNVTDKALVSFAIKFATGTGYKTAKFIVAYDSKADEPYSVTPKFYDESETEYELTLDNLNKFLSATEKSAVKTREKPIVYHNAKYGTYEIVNLSEPSAKIASRLASAGFNVEDNFWVDKCRGPEFGRLCYRVDVDPDQADHFLKIAAMPDKEWADRAGEELRSAPYKTPNFQKSPEWADRAKEREGYTSPDLKDGQKWVDRALEKGPDGNPYDTEAKMLASDASKKENLDKAKQTLENKREASKDVLNSLDELEALISS